MENQGCSFDRKAFKPIQLRQHYWNKNQSTFYLYKYFDGVEKEQRKQGHKKLFFYGQADSKRRGGGESQTNLKIFDNF